MLQEGFAVEQGAGRHAMVLPLMISILHFRLQWLQEAEVQLASCQDRAPGLAEARVTCREFLIVLDRLNASMEGGQP